MSSILEILAKKERNNLTTVNLYKYNWNTPDNVSNKYSVIHTRAISDAKTPIYGKGTGIFLDTTNGGGDYDINGNSNYTGSGRLKAIALNTSLWSYSPSTPYSVKNTRALSDNSTPVYGKGTGIFLDTTNGGGDYDINGNSNYVGSGRLQAIALNTSLWTYNSTTPYSVKNTRALSDNITPVYGKGTGIFLDTTNGGGYYDINGNSNYVGSGRLQAIALNTSLWTYNSTTPYSVVNTRALSDAKTPVYGKGTGIFLDTYNGGGDYDINGNANYKGSGRLQAMSLNLSTWMYGPAPADQYSVTHTRAIQNTNTPIYGKGTGIELDTANGGGSLDVAQRNKLIIENTAKWSYSLGTPYSVVNTRALSDTNTPVYGKGTGIFLDTYNGGGEYDIKGNVNYNGSGRINNIKINTYKPNYKDNLDDTNWYTMRHPNALATDDVNGKGTNDGIGLDGVYAAHSNYNGGSSVDVNNRKSLNLLNATKNSVNKPYGYGYKNTEWYTAPLCEGKNINLGTIKF